MTASNKQIKEMANIASKCTTSWLNNETPKTLPNHIAEALYNTGYRKVSEIAREMIDVLCELHDLFKSVGDIRGAFAMLFAIAELKKKYTEGVENEKV